MVSVVYKKYGLIKINAIWFFEGVFENIKQSKADIIFLHGVNTNEFKNSTTQSQYTLITDLTEPADNIFKVFNKNFRYEINRAKKDGVQCEVVKAEELKKNPAMLNTFKQEYNQFTRLKGIANTYNGPAMDQYLANDNLILTKVYQDKTNYAQHVYIGDGKMARLLYSVSNFRYEGSDQNLIGRANKYLHWYDIQYLQSYKYHTLDWGGISNMVNPNGVDIFKKGFGGREHQYYNVIMGNSLAGRLVMKVYRG